MATTGARATRASAYVNIGRLRLTTGRPMLCWCKCIRTKRGQFAGHRERGLPLGEHIVLRFPLQRLDASDARRMLDSEASAAAELLGRTRFPTPEPIAIGEPELGYPMPWLAMTWLTGTVATEVDPSTSAGLPHDLAEFINDLRHMDSRGRVFRGDRRGGDLRAHDAWVNTCFERSQFLLDVPAHRRVWSDLRDLPRISPDVVTHGDLIPGNLLVSGRRLAGVLDVGDLGPADPALDLVCAWHLFDDSPRQALRQDLDSDDLEWDAERPGPSNRRWARSGTTPTATHRWRRWAAERFNASSMTTTPTKLPALIGACSCGADNVSEPVNRLAACPPSSADAGA